MRMILLLCVFVTGQDFCVSLHGATNCGFEKSPKMVLLAGDDLDFQEVNVNIRPRFSSGGHLTMGNWSYKAYRITNRRTREVSFALQLNIEIQVGQFELPPLTINATALNRDRREVGSGFLMAKGLNIGKANLYSGLLIMTSWDVDEIDLTPG
jgi:hypothetical protein